MIPFDLDAWLAALDSLPAGAGTGASAEPGRAQAQPPIVQAGAAVLRAPAVEVPPEMFGTPALLRLIDVMVQTMRDAPGVGLAAPQIGVPLRIYVAEDQAERMAQLSAEAREIRARTALPLTVFVNPTVTLVAGAEATFFEGCLSVRGYGALVTRAAAVAVEAFDARGIPFDQHLQGWPARIMQHEMDHLDGTLYVDRMISRSFACDTELARLSGIPVTDILRDLFDLPSRTRPPPVP
jgi:peptide deformylase